MTIKPIRQAWKGTMTPRERFNRQMHFLPVDRSVNMEFGYWEENYTQWKMFSENGVTNEWQANRFFNFDPIAGISGRVFMYPTYEEKEIGRTANGKRILQNQDGLIAEQPLDGHSTIPHYIKAQITAADWYAVKALRFDVSHPARIVDIEALKARHLPDAGRDYPLGVDCGSMIGRIRDMLTFEGLCYASYDEPEIVEDMVETSCRLVEHFLDQVLPHFKFDFTSGWEDI